MDQNIPIAKILTTNYGIAAAVDVKGSMRLYDLIRYRKICKVSSTPRNDVPSAAQMMSSSLSVQSITSLMGETCFRLFPRVCFETLGDQFVIVSTSKVIDEPSEEQWNGPPEEEDPKKKKGKDDEEE